LFDFVADIYLFTKVLEVLENWHKGNNIKRYVK